MKRERFAQPARRIQAATSTDFYSKLIEKEMQLYKINPNERPKHLELLFKALKTIKHDDNAELVTKQKCAQTHQ